MTIAVHFCGGGALPVGNGEFVEAGDLGALQAAHLDPLYFRKALAKLDRYGGLGGLHNYSVAAHSCYLAMMMVDDPELRLAALLHDAHEPITGDVRYHMRRSHPALQAVEDATAEALRVNWGVSASAYDALADADRLLAGLEMRAMRWPVEITMPGDEPSDWAAHHMTLDGVRHVECQLAGNMHQMAEVQATRESFGDLWAEMVAKYTERLARARSRKV